MFVFRREIVWRFVKAVIRLHLLRQLLPLLTTTTTLSIYHLISTVYYRLPSHFNTADSCML